MPYADFCSAVRLPRDSFSRRNDTEQISRVSSTAFCALPSDLRSAYLMDMGFAVSCPILIARPVISATTRLCVLGNLDRVLTFQRRLLD